MVEAGKRVLKKLPFIVLGNLCYALSINLFLVPNQIATGGFAGISIILNHLLSLPVGVMTFVMNAPLFLLVRRRMGKTFFLSCLVSMVCMSLLIDLTVKVPSLTNDRLMASAYGGVLMGVGMGILYRFRSSSGGSELLGRLMAETVAKGLSLGQCTLIIDGVVVAAATLVFGNIESGLYAAVTIYITSKMADAIIHGFDYAKICYVITTKPEEVAQAFLSRMKRGMTAMQGEGMYSREPRQVMFTVIRKGEAQLVKDIVKEADPGAFVIVSEAVEVLGSGFKALDEPKED